MSEGTTLLEIQRCDTGIARAQRELDELPALKAIMECRAKRKELKGKQDQVVEHLDDVESKLLELQEEEDQIVSKVKELQERLDDNADYRETASITKDMEAQVERQSLNAQAQEDLLERQIKIEALAQQVVEALAKIDQAESQRTEQFKAEGGVIKARIDELQSKRDDLARSLDADVLKRYEALRAEKNGTAVSELEDDHCTVCRSIIPDGILARFRKGSGVDECPNCHRIIVIASPLEGSGQ